MLRIQPQWQKRSILLNCLDCFLPTYSKIPNYIQYLILQPLFSESEVVGDIPTAVSSHTELTLSIVSCRLPWLVPAGRAQGAMGGSCRSFLGVCGRHQHQGRGDEEEHWELSAQRGHGVSLNSQHLILSTNTTVTSYSIKRHIPHYHYTTVVLLFNRSTVCNTVLHILMKSWK